MTSDSRTLVFPRTKRKIVSMQDLVDGEIEIKQVISELAQDTHYALNKADQQGELKPMYLFSLDSFYKFLDDAH
ncbi:hypothetical protein N9M10_01355 [Hellea sp.]|nr:hypothetical protein [Hellea sp.]